MKNRLGDCLSAGMDAESPKHIIEDGEGRECVLHGNVTAFRPFTNDTMRCAFAIENTVSRTKPKTGTRAVHIVMKQDPMHCLSAFQRGFHIEYVGSEIETITSSGNTVNTIYIYMQVRRPLSITEINQT